MNMSEWADKEVELYLKKHTDEDSEYGNMCVKAALEAFKVLCRQGHSGMSIGFTMSFLKRLVDGSPLTPIEDTDDVWNEVEGINDGGEEPLRKTFQCKRMSSLFKDIHADGSITYHDNNRSVAYELKDEDHMVPWHSGNISRFLDKIEPIKMPYCPSSKRYVFTIDSYMVDKNNKKYYEPGSYMVQDIIGYTDPEGEYHEVNKTFAENPKTRVMEEVEWRNGN